MRCSREAFLIEWLLGRERSRVHCPLPELQTPAGVLPELCSRAPRDRRSRHPQHDCRQPASGGHHPSAASTQAALPKRSAPTTQDATPLDPGNGGALSAPSALGEGREDRGPRRPSLQRLGQRLRHGRRPGCVAQRRRDCTPATAAQAEGRAAGQGVGRSTGATPPAAAGGSTEGCAAGAAHGGVGIGVEERGAGLRRGGGEAYRWQ